jgi:hypothetical protein
MRKVKIGKKMTKNKETKLIGKLFLSGFAGQEKKLDI